MTFLLAQYVFDFSMVLYASVVHSGLLLSNSSCMAILVCFHSSTAKHLGCLQLETTMNKDKSLWGCMFSFFLDSYGTFF